jgi:xanthosine utilization system XapX-like protein
MNASVLSAAVGLLVGVIYGVLNVRSPAPPVRQWLQRDTHQASWIEQKVRPHMFGQMPGCDQAKAQAGTPAKAETHDV